MQINRTGYLLFGFFGGIGMIFILIGLLIGGQVLSIFGLIGGIWVAVTLGLVAYAFQQARKGRHEQWLWKTGVKGRGTLVSASSNVQINDQPLMKLELDLELPGQPARRVTRKVIISEFAAHLMQPGLVLPVYVNPQDPDDVLVVW